ncbi:PAS domain S-box protein [Pleomorphovibrio marinus]|uniref:PAS domain S-box protein n=1 Tax=Pleomorphovibrio marinus TaxID=2164132 RepID=UPI000E0C59E9|nr:PAS domain S-box protein [Pleomorphovibrio marinus]
MDNSNTPSKVEDTQRHKNPKHIIGIGASAGGLEALQEFLSHFPELPETCVIIAQHVSPTHKSRLVQLLSKETSLLIKEAVNGESLESNVVFITPPDRDILLNNGNIVLQQPGNLIGPKPSIDLLFKSLSADEFTIKIGIILSGTGSDGAFGALALKESGGILIVQDPETAKYDGMPKATINTAVVDFIMAPKQMGRKIEEFLENPEKLKLNGIPKNRTYSSLERILSLLNEKCGTDFSNYKSPTIGRRIGKRLQSLGLETNEKYLEYIEKNPEEIEELFNTILIGVTSFYRDKESFLALEKAVKELIDKKDNQQPIRVWVPGCSTGQEAYTMAILIHEQFKSGGKNFKLQLFATDIDENAIAVGRRGIYPESSLENLPKSIRDTYFESIGKDFQVIKTIRSCILFSKHDLIKNPPFLKLDLISCRNLFIYFSAALQQQIIPLFHHALYPGALLFLGKSENIGNFTDLFSVYDTVNKIFRKKDVKSIHNLKFPSLKTQEPPFPQHQKTSLHQKDLSLKDKIKETLYNSYEHPYVIVNEELDILQVNGDVRLYMTLSSGSIQVNLLKLVNEELQIEVRAILAKSMKNRANNNGNINRFTLFGQDHFVRVSAKPILYSPSSGPLFMVVFEKLEIEEYIARGRASSPEEMVSSRIYELEHELAATKEHLQTYIEQIESSNEEMQSLNEEFQSTNEELQSSNEELETSNEELQSTNEEIQIAYSELKAAFDEIEKKEQALQRMQANNEALLNNDLQAFILVDTKYKVINFNQKAKQLIHSLIGRNIAKGQSMIDLLPLGHVEDFVSNFSASCKGKIYKGEKVFKDKKLKTRWFSVNYTPSIYLEDEVIAISLGFMEITDLKETIKKLTASEKLVNSVFHIVSTGVCITDDKGRFIEVNEAYCEIYGYTKEELIGKPFTMMVAPKKRKSIQELHDAFFINGKEPPTNVEVIKKNGEKIIVSVFADLLVNPDGERFKITSVTDITKEKIISDNLDNTLLRLKERAKEQACLIEIISLGSEMNNVRELLGSVSSIISKGYQFSEKTSVSITYGEAIFRSSPFKKSSHFQSFKKKTKENKTLEVTVFNHTKNKVPFLPEEQTLLNSIGSNLVLTINHYINSTQIEESERRFKSLVQRGADLICIVDAEGRYRFVSPNYENLLGYSSEDLLGKTGFDFIHPEDLPKIKAAFEKHQEQEKITSPAYRFKAKDGSYFWLQGTSTNLVDDPAIQGIVINTMNVTPLIEIQNELEISEKKYRNLFEFSPLPKWIYRLEDYRILDVNKVALSEYGYSREEFLSLTIKDLRPKNHVNNLLAAHKNVESLEGVIKFGVFTHMRKDGSQMQMDITGQMLKYRGKDCMMVDCMDVTEREKLTQDLLDKEAKLEKAHEVAKMGYWSHNLSSDTLYWSPMMHKIWENPADNQKVDFEVLIGSVHPSDRNLVKEERKKLLAGKNDKYDAQYRILTHSGKLKWIHSRAYLVKDPLSDETILEGTSQDITFQKNLEIQDQLENSLGRIFNQEASLSSSFSYVLTYLLHHLQFDIAEAWILSADRKNIHLLAIQSSEESKIKKEKTIAIKSVKKGEDLAGMVWEKNEVCIWENSNESHYSWKNSFNEDEEKITTVIGSPLTHAGKTLGVILFASKSKIEEHSQFHSLLKKLQNFLGTELYRKKLEEELGRIFNSSPDIICVAGVDGYFKKINPAMCELLGYTEEEILSSPIVAFTHPEDRDKTQNELKEINNIKGHSTFENRYLTKTGKTLWLSWNSRYFHEEEVIYSVAKDVTKQKDLEILLDNATKMSRIGGWEYNLATQKVYFSEMTREIHELEKKDTVSLSDAIHFYRKDVRNKVKEAIKMGIEKGIPWDFELPIVTAKENERWVRCIGKPDYKDGSCNRIYGSFQDIHKRKTAELDLGKKTEYLFALANIIENLLAKEDWFKALESCFEIAGKATKVDRVYYFEKHTDPDNPVKHLYSQRFEWNSGDFPSQMDNPELQNVPIELLVEFETPLSKGSPFQAIVSSLPSSQFKSTLESQNIKSILCLPIFLRNTYHGLIGFDDCKEERIWDKEEVSFLTSISSNLSTAILQRMSRLALEEALSEKEEILESIQDGFYALDKNWKITYWNKEAERMLQRKRKEVIGKNIWSEFQEAVSLKFYTEYYRAVQENIPVKFEEFFPSLGEWFDVSAFPSHNGLTVYFRDITERKMAELELLKFQRIIENSQDGIALASGKGEPLYVNRSFATSLGYSTEEFREKGDPGTVYADVEVAEEVFGTLLSGKFWKGDVKLINKQGKEIDFFLSGGPIFDEAGNLVAIFGIHTDISERKRAEEEIRRSNERFLKVTEATLDAIWDWNIIDNKVFKGEGYYTLFGYEPHEKSSSLDVWTSRIHSEDLEKVKSSIGEVLDQPNQSKWQSEYRYLKKNGEYATVVDRGIIIRDKNGKAIRMVGSMMDVTQRKAYENSLKELNLTLEKQTAELATSNAELEQFAYVASHDLQEPLRMVSSFLTQLNNKYSHKLDDRGLTYIGFAVDGAKRMRNIILDLLDYSRIGKGDEEMVELDMQELVEEIMLLHQSTIKEKKAKITMGKLPVLKNYKTPVMQVMQNLIGNALKYSRPEGTPRVEINAEFKDNRWVFAISDNGIGIEEEYFDKIFVIFQRLHTKEEYSGTGMGLAIVRKILENLGEKIWLTSEPGKGSTFYFTLNTTP